MEVRGGREERTEVEKRKREGMGEGRARVKNTIGVTVTTSVEAPGTIERSMGKMRRIVDQRPR